MVCGSPTLALKKLRKEFSRLQKKRLGARFGITSDSLRVLYDWSSDEPLDPNEPERSTARMMHRVAKLYVLVETEGMAAALLWKIRLSA